MMRRIVLATLCFKIVAAADLAAEVLERVIVRVNGEIITLSELQSRQIAALRSAQVPFERIDEYLRQNNQKILQEAIDDLLISQRSAEIDGEIDEATIAKVVEEIKKDYKIENDDEFVRALEQEGMTREELKRNIARSMLMRRYFVREVEPQVKVSEADARAYYESRKASEYTHPELVELREILIPEKAGEAKAREIAARARAGEDFAGLASSHSSSSTSASGGDLGRVAERDLHPDLARAVAALEPGQVSDPVATRAGFQILKLVKREQQRVVPFDEVKEDIRRDLERKRGDEVFAKIITKLREDAIIEDMVREVPLEVTPQEALSAQKPSLLDAAAAAERSDEEFSVTPMDKPIKSSVGRSGDAAVPSVGDERKDEPAQAP
jgi:peptidyl-prolyl cis-trans isomerase SurA